MMTEASFTRGRKWRVGFNVVLALVSAFALVVMANYLAARHSTRYNWADAAGNKLSPQTQRALASVTNKVRVIVFFRRDELPLFAWVTGLLKDYQLRCPMLDVEVVDYRYPGRSEKIRNEYNLSGGVEGSRIIFDCNGRTRVVGSGELSDYGFGADRQIRRTAFKGEQLFTSAIMSVTSSQRFKAYFLTGHGENSPQSQEDTSGYSVFAKMLSEANVDLAMFESLHSREVPEDCSLLVVPGPTKRFSPEELERLDRYLTQGGRMLTFLAAFNPKYGLTGLENLLAKWNVEVGQNLVIDQAQSRANADTFSLIANTFGQHAITRPLLRASLQFYFSRLVGSRAIGAVRADAPKTTELVFSSPDGIAVGPADEKGSREIQRKGPVPLAVAVEKGGIQGVAGDKGATRLVVVGSSVSFANAPIMAAANADFATLSVNWLLNREAMMTDIPPRAIKEYSITISDHQMRTLRWTFIFFAPAAALAMGGLVWLRRRK
jgi:hypothetical protein